MTESPAIARSAACGAPHRRRIRLDDIIAAATLADERATPAAWPRMLHALIEQPGTAWSGPPPRIGEIVDSHTIRDLGMDAESPWPLHRIMSPLLRVPAAMMQRALGASTVEVDPSATRDLLLQLTRRWARLCSSIFVHRVTAADVLMMHPGHVGDPVCQVFFGTARPTRLHWLDLFAHAPVLARLIAVVACGWLDALTEIVRRLDADTGVLAAALQAGPRYGRLTSVTADLGETHDGGRSVAVLRFANGPAVVYKPRHLEIAELYFEIVRELNAMGGAPRLHERRVLARGDYAWEEFVVVSECDSLAGVRRYYERMGAHARLLQLFGATDFTTDNVLACGDHPVLVDLETLITPLVRDGRAVSTAERRATERALAIPVRSGLVTARMDGESARRGADLGALAGRGRWTAPFRQTAVRRAEDGTPRLDTAYLEFAGNSAMARYDGDEVDPSTYREEVANGYVRMDALLARAAPRLLVSASVARLATARVRFIARDTHIYARLLGESLRRDCLRDVFAWDRSLSRVKRAQFPSARINEHELDALRSNDVPTFHAEPGSGDLVFGAGRRIPKYFAAPATQRVHAELVRLASSVGRNAADDIGTALFVLAPEARAPARARRRLVARDFVGSDEELLRLATNIGDYIADLAVRDRRGHIAWAGVAYAPDRDRWRAGALPPHLLSGTAGLAMLFAALFRLTNADRFADLARAVIVTLQRRILDTLRRGGSRRERRPSQCGAFQGWGGWWYAWHRGAQLLGDQTLAREARTVLSASTVSRCLDGAPASVVDGVAGFALALTGGETPLPGAQWPDIATVVLARLEAGMRSGADHDAPPPSTDALGGLPVSIHGERLARLRLLRASGAAVAESGTAPRSAFGIGGAFPPNAGDVLAQLDTARWCRTDRTAVDELALTWLRRAKRTRSSPVDIMEVAVTAADLSDSMLALSIARSAAARLVQTHCEHGSWNPHRWVADRHHLCAVDGTAAVAYACLRVAARHLVPSLRLLA